MTTVAAHPFTDTSWIVAGSVLGGRYPGGRSAEECRRIARQLVELGVVLVVNLQEPDEDGRDGTSSYEPHLLRAARRGGRPHLRVLHEPIPEHGLPTLQQMRRILDEIDAVTAAGGRSYVHCWDGHDRTSLVAGCLLRRHGLAPAEPLEAVRAAQTAEQREFVRAWSG